MRRPVHNVAEPPGSPAIEEQHPIVPRSSPADESSTSFLQNWSWTPAHRQMRTDSRSTHYSLLTLSPFYVINY